MSLNEAFEVVERSISHQQSPKYMNYPQSMNQNQKKTTPQKYLDDSTQKQEKCA